LKKAALPLVLASKQLWKTKIGYIRLSEVGKSLAHYRLAATPKHRGQKVHTTTIERLKSYLTENEAVLMEEETPQAKLPGVTNPALPHENGIARPSLRRLMINRAGKSKG